jgi:predicted nucleic acid-binding protein
MTGELFHEAILLFREARKKGVTVRSSVDCLIAASAIRHGATVLHRDRDFDNLARVTSLKSRRVL